MNKFMEALELLHNNTMDRCKDCVEDHFECHWQLLPTELLCLIFDHIDSKTLVKCMFVCRSWNNAAQYVAERKSLWEEIVSMYVLNKGDSYRLKSAGLQWRDIFINSILWTHCDKADVSLHFTYQIDDIKLMNVYRDNLIVISGNTVKYYNILTQSLIREINTSCIDFVETDEVIMQVTRNWDNLKNVHLFSKAHYDDFNIKKANQMLIAKVMHYRLNKNSCYIFDSRCLLIRYKWKEGSWHKSVVARYYGNSQDTIALNVFDKEVYIMVKQGLVMFANVYKGFEKLLRVAMPHSDAKSPIYTKMFYRFGVVFGGANNNKFCFQRYDYEIEGDNVFILDCPNLSCMTQHSDVLFNGYADGKVEFFMPRNVTEANALKRTLDVNEFNKESMEHKLVASIDTYEEKERQHLVVATRSHIFHLLVQHPDRNKYLWSEYPPKISSLVEEDGL